MSYGIADDFEFLDCAYHEFSRNIEAFFRRLLITSLIIFLGVLQISSTNLSMPILLPTE